MKKKNLITTVASVALVGVIAVGSTLAYLSAQDTELTNHFEFANNIGVDVYEYDVATPDSGASKEQSGFTYNNLVTGQDVIKNVDVDLTTTVKTDLYVLVDMGSVGNSMILTETQITNNGWTKVNITDAGKVLYKRTVEGDAEVKSFNVFETLKVPEVSVSGSTSSQTVTLNDVKIDVFAIQNENLSGTTADQEAAKNLAVTLG